MLTGEQIICIDDFVYSYADDLYWDDSFFLKKYHIYTIKNMTHNVTQQKNKVDIEITLCENYNITLDSNRFISVQEYRKQKLIKLNRCSK